jgi:DNA-binding GntR family transcriptional regulator
LDPKSKIQSSGSSAAAPYRTMVDIAFERLRDKILSGELRPGQRIGQDAVAAEFQISRMPLREALRRLEAGGFVKIVPHRGALVTSITRTDIEEIYFIRTSLESASAGLAAERMTESILDELRSVLAYASDAIADGDTVRIAEANQRFHLVGHQATGMPKLTQMIAELTDHSNRYRLLHSALLERARISLGEHQAILDAWERRDPVAAAEAMRINLVNSELALVEAIDRSNTNAIAKEAMGE